MPINWQNNSTKTGIKKICLLFHNVYKKPLHLGFFECPNFHLSKTRSQSNSAFPSLRFTTLCCSQNHLDNSSLFSTLGGFFLTLTNQ